MAEELADGDWSEYNNGDFFNYIGEFMGDWLDCLEGIEQAAEPAANRRV